MDRFESNFLPLLIKFFSPVLQENQELFERSQESQVINESQILIQI